MREAFPRTAWDQEDVAAFLGEPARAAWCVARCREAVDLVVAAERREDEAMGPRWTEPRARLLRSEWARRGRGRLVWAGGGPAGEERRGPLVRERPALPPRPWAIAEGTVCEDPLGEEGPSLEPRPGVHPPARPLAVKVALVVAAHDVHAGAEAIIRSDLWRPPAPRPALAGFVGPRDEDDALRWMEEGREIEITDPEAFKASAAAVAAFIRDHGEEERRVAAWERICRFARRLREEEPGVLAGIFAAVRTTVPTAPPGGDQSKAAAPQDMRPAGWFNEATEAFVYPKLLAEARKAGRIRGWQPQPRGPWLYSIEEVKREWPEKTTDIDDFDAHGGRRRKPGKKSRG